MIVKSLEKGLLVMLSVVLFAACGSKDTANDEGVVEDTSGFDDAPVEEFSDDGFSDTEVAGDQDAQLRETRTVNFDFDMSNIRGEYDEMLAAHGRYIANNPDLQVTVEGHADERGTPEYNIALGERRANSVIDVLISYGASSSQFQAISYGEEKPIDFGHDEMAWEQNRRAEIKY